MAKTANNGRSNKKDRYIAFPHSIMDTAAWRRLPVTARAAWLEFIRVHSGFNNGRLAMSSRILGKKLGLCKSGAAKAINELITYGFLEITRASSFSGKRRATEYQLTHLKNDFTGELPSRAFQNIGKIACNSGNVKAAKEPQSTSFPLSTQTDNIGHPDGQGLSTQTDTVSPIVHPDGL